MSYAKVYLVTNLVNGHRYIGVTGKPIETRWSEHVSRARYAPQVICRAIRKYGREAFTITEIFGSKDYLYVLKEAEPFFIARDKPEYNATVGGDGIPGYRHTEETKRKCAMSHKGKHHTDEWKQRMSKLNRGRKMPVEHVEHLKELFGQPIAIDEQQFKSKNDAARYLTRQYSISRNTALRRIAKGITDFTSWPTLSSHQ